MTADAARDYLTHLAVHQRVSASTQNQALAAILLLCRDVLGVQIEGLANAVKAKRGRRLPVVRSVSEVAALLGRMRGTTWLMAALIAHLRRRARVSEAASCASRTSTSTRA